jgi:extradiol dioxygenase family protein
MKSKIDHIAILVDDLDIASEWYLTKLNGEITFRDDKYVRLRVANTNIALIDKQFYPNPHFGVLVESKKDLPTDIGTTVYHRDGTVGVYVKDPFGNYLEYIWYSDEMKKVFLNDD